MIGARLSDEQFDRALRLATTLYPRTVDMPSPADIDRYATLLQKAITACGVPPLEIETAFSGIPETPTWNDARAFAAAVPSSFRIVSMLISAAYYMVPEVLACLRYPIDRQHPADVEEFVSEYETGILDAVIERGPCYRNVPGRQS